MCIRHGGAPLARVLVLGLALLTQAGVEARAADPAPAGRVEFAIGSPTAAGQDNRARPLARGASVFEGDLINTGAGRVQVRFTDGGFISLQPQTQFKVEQYRYAGKQDGSEKGIFNLVKGGMRTITGLIGKNENKNYRVHTKVATIGVRGTEYSLNMDTTLQGSVAQGQIDVCSAGGCAPFARGESFMVQHGAARPVMTLRKTGLPAPQPGEKHQKEPSGEDGGKPPAQTASAPPPGDADAQGSPPPNGPPPGGTLAPDGPPPPGGAPAPVGPPPDPLAVTNVVPPPPAAPNPDFVQGNATDLAGTSSVLKLTGPHFLAYILAPYMGTGLFPSLVATTMGNVVLDSNGVAQSIGALNLTNATGGSNGFSAGGLGFQGISPLNVHYALGYPTLPADIQALQISTPVLAYTHFKGTDPTGYFGSIAPGSAVVVGKFLGGNLNVNLATSVANAQVSLDINGTALGVNGSLALNLGNPATTFGGGCTAGASANCAMTGFLVGPKAQGALMVYGFHNVNVGANTVTAQGMVSFQRPP